jgi:DedD protein
MQFKGDEFVRNVKIEKEKAQLQKQAEALEAQKNETVVQPTPLYDDEPVLVDIKENLNNNPEMEDIRISDDTNIDKKRYIILSIALIILFILTIVIIRVISDDNKDDKLFNNVKQDNLLSSKDANERYQRLIEKKTKQTIQKELDINKIVKDEVPLPKIDKQPKKLSANSKITEPTKKLPSDLFDMEKKPTVQEPKTTTVKKNITTEKEIKKPKTKPIKSVAGTYIQIGAFVNKPNKSLLIQIKNKGFKYLIHKVKIKGTLYNKLLIGPYQNRAKANSVIKQVRKEFKNKNAYILELK